MSLIYFFLSEQRCGTGDHTEGDQSTIDSVNARDPTSHTQLGDDTETPVNHDYDELINYTTQVTDTQTDHSHEVNKSIENTGADTNAINKFVEDRRNSETHTYAVLEEAVPPVPER